jgi:TRAP-type C4-dicarboxylate transport system substrate-binding protein
MRRLCVAAMIIALAGWSGLATAQELPKLNFKVLVQDSPSPQVKLVQMPFWKEWLVKNSGGQITADATPYDQAGIPDDAVLRLLKLGAFDFASFDIARSLATIPFSRAATYPA